MAKVEEGTIRFEGPNCRKTDEESRPCRELGETQDDALV